MPRKMFECADCRREVFVLSGIVSDAKFCASCLMLPGWSADPTLAHLLNPAPSADAAVFLPKPLKEPSR